MRGLQHLVSGSVVPMLVSLGAQLCVVGKARRASISRAQNAAAGLPKSGLPKSATHLAMRPMPAAPPATPVQVWSPTHAQ